jgi:hypothetical protein
MKKLLIALLFVTPLISFGATLLYPSQGGTGIGTATVGQIGYCLKVSNNSPFAYTLGTCGSSSAWPFDILTNYGVTNAATTTPIWAQNGLNASSTSHFVYASTTGLSISGLTSSRIPYASTGGLLTDNSALTFDGTRLNATYASSTSITTSGATYLATTSGNVGIGTTGPIGKMQVTGSNLNSGGAGVSPTLGNANLFISNNGSTGIAMDDNQIESTAALYMNFNTNSAVSIGGTSSFSGLGLGTGASSLGSMLSINGNAAIGASYYGNAAPANGMIVEGNVGIGSTNPGANLSVAGNTFSLGGTNNNSSTIYKLGNDDLRIENWGRTTDTGAVNINYNGYLGGTTVYRDFGVYNGKNTNILFIDGSAGNVGIGTTTPSEKLDVNGNLRIENQGQLKFSELRVNGNHIATLSATSSMVADINWTLPAVKGEAGQVLMTNGLGNLDWTTISGGTGTGNVGTSTTPTRGQIPYWTTSGANLELLGSVATGTIACSGTVSCSTTGLSVIGGNLSIIGSGLTSYDSWTHPSAGISATTSLIQLFGQASSTLLSANWLQIGGSATTTIDTAGKISTNNATSTLFSATTAWISNLIGTITGTGTWDLSGATVKQHLYPSFSYATSTAWTGTTTIYLAPSYQAETWNGVKCETNTGTLNVSFYDGTNRMNMLNASTTIGTFTLSTNNSFTAGESRRVDIGNPASSPTKISCSVDKTIN